MTGHRELRRTGATTVEPHVILPDAGWTCEQVCMRCGSALNGIEQAVFGGVYYAYYGYPCGCPVGMEGVTFTKTNREDTRNMTGISMRATDRKTGLTLGELATFVERARLVELSDDTPLKVTAGLREQIVEVRTT